MRICMLNDNFYRGSGITLVIERLAASQGFQEIELFLAGCRHFKGRSAFEEGASIVDPAHRRSFGLMGHSPAVIREMVRFGQWLRAIRCEVLHVHHRRLAVFARAIGAALGIPVLFTGHLTFADALWFKWMSPRTATGVSPSVVKYLQRCTKGERIELIYNPYEFESHASAVGQTQRLEADPSATGLRAISVGRLEPVKAHAVLIKAWARLRDKGVSAQLDIFGDGPLRSALAELIRAKGLEGCVHLRGFAPDITDRLAGYSFHVLASEREGFPNVVVEAAARWRPSLLTNVDGSRDTLPGTGLLLPNAVPFGDAEILSEALRTWFGSPEKVRADGERFHDHLKELCSPDIIGDQYKTLYRLLLASKAANGLLQ